MINSKTAIANLASICNILNINNTKHWLQDGTLLGLYRDKNFISHDTDTDMGILFETFNPKVFESFKRCGFKVYHVFGYVEDSLEIGLIKDGLKTDLFFHYKNGPSQYHCAFTGSNYTRRVDFIYDQFDTKMMSFQGTDFPVPEDVLKFILTKYGEDWSTPDEKWNYATSPKNHKLTDIYFDKNISANKFNTWVQGLQK